MTTRMRMTTGFSVAGYHPWDTVPVLHTEMMKKRHGELAAVVEGVAVAVVVVCAAV